MRLPGSSVTRFMNIGWTSDLKFLVGEPPSSTYSDHLTSCFPADNRLGETSEGESKSCATLTHPTQA